MNYERIYDNFHRYILIKVMLMTNKKYVSNIYKGKCIMELISASHSLECRTSHKG